MTASLHSMTGRLPFGLQWDMAQWDFASEWAWFLFLLLPVVMFGVFWWQRRHTGSFTFGNTLVVREVRGDFIGQLWWLPGLLRVLAVAAVIVALARPQKPNRKVISTRGVDVMVAIDMSASMNAVDKSPDEIDRIKAGGENPANRFDIARDLLIEFIKNRSESGDRIGLVIFGAGAYPKFPLTTDYRRAIKDIKDLVLDDGTRDGRDIENCLNDCTISGAMTTIGDALRRSFLRLRDSQARERSIILITDGDDRGSKMAPKYVAEYIRDWGNQTNPETQRKNKPIPVYTFLVGGGGDPYMPDVSFSNRIIKDRNGLIQYRRVPAGQFPANPQLLEEIAKLTGGQAFQSYDEETFREQFKSLEETVYKRTINNFPDERFMPLVWIAFFLLGVEMLLRLTILRKFP